MLFDIQISGLPADEKYVLDDWKYPDPLFSVMTISIVMTFQSSERLYFSSAERPDTWYRKEYGLLDGEKYPVKSMDNGWNPNPCT